MRLFLQKRDDFCCHFVDVCEQGKCWKDMEDFLDTSQETRIPSDLLCSSEAESCFKSHLQHLFAIEKKKEYVFSISFLHGLVILAMYHKQYTALVYASHKVKHWYLWNI